VFRSPPATAGEDTGEGEVGGPQQGSSTVCVDCLVTHSVVVVKMVQYTNSITDFSVFNHYSQVLNTLLDDLTKATLS